ncbi:MAG: hypothetical protein KTR28_01335 [Micavibrio sp.]|nr:hypothetical protein [Micavibrio sp.]
MKLKDPDLGAYSVWDTVWGERGFDESYSDGVLLPNSELLVVGLKTKHDSDSDKSFHISQIRKNGRPRWVKYHAIKNLDEVFNIIKVDEGFVVLGALKEGNAKHQAWIGFFDTAGELNRESVISGAAKGGVPKQLISIPTDFKNPANFILIANTIEGPSKSLIYTLDAKAHLIGVRSFDFGSGNVLNGISAVEDGFIGSGYVLDRNGVKSGWAFKLDKSGEFVWQREYPRGAGAQLNAGDALLSDAYVFVGSSAPMLEGGKVSAWIMATSRANGGLLWQRFYSIPLVLTGEGLIVTPQGLITMVTQATSDFAPGLKTAVEPIEDDVYTPPKFDDSHMRLLVHGPRGKLLNVEEYFNGQGVKASRIISGAKGQRVLLGSTSVVYRALRDGEKQPDIITEEAWISAAVPVNEYVDPCAPKPRPKF